MPNFIHYMQASFHLTVHCLKPISFLLKLHYRNWNEPDGGAPDDVVGIVASFFSIRSVLDSVIGLFQNMWRNGVPPTIIAYGRSGRRLLHA